ncbi:MAG: NADH-quinone oxidoreductase subunit H [Candidatus Marsarchaeota archaeon]|jgi:NADH-quinone oxidoreductase subunit H|nr:NADH-quinone oxidoreductase subunit H [Candidatus Marsarchaeota archaeon]
MIPISSGTVSSYYNFIAPIVQRLIGSTPFTDPISLFVALVVFAIILSLLFSIFAYLFGWLERKLIARAQSRHGPTYVGKWGILQNLADLVKLVTKENIIPDDADRPLFQMMIPLMVATFVLILAFVPFTNDFVGISSGLSLIFAFLLIAFVPLLVFLAGWTSGNKFGSISAARSVVMLLSYEIPLILVVAGIVMVSGSLNLSTIITAQTSSWYVAVMPIGAVLFFVVMLAELERPPFDIREADSELIAGWLTDVSAPYYAMVLLLDYTRMFVGALLIAVLFFGGWLGPGFLPPFAWLMIKVVLITLFIILIRATTVRMRLDRLIRLGWVYMMPLAVVNLLLTFAIFVK